jgi:hypothetical protein
VFGAPPPPTNKFRGICHMQSPGIFTGKRESMALFRGLMTLHEMVVLLPLRRNHVPR